MISFSVLRARKENTTQQGGVFFSYLRRQNQCCALRVMRPTSVARWVASPSAASGRRSEGAVSAAVGKHLAHFAARRCRRAPQTGRYAEPFSQMSVTKTKIESCRPNQHCEPKKISVRKTQKPQRFLGFFVPFFKVEFKRYHLLKMNVEEDLN